MNRIALLLSLTLLLLPATFAGESEDRRAIKLVCQRKEVKQWEKDLAHSKNAGVAGYTVSRDYGDRYVVKVSEDYPDRNVTFKIYYVDLRDGSVLSVQ